ncbi:Ppx/GppA family phosphatase [Liquorilactobacillus capillatus]|uniref:Exopolyphosphatase n=1 Tax=Liquorilactobacillus capillatus DSM 19910 TaxID=1423731 RepID=A0A0R1LWR2_9LACO|nr:Ppx/GppA family phosphatase [Liquorilactobacillus capillatus]KRL00108.1 exopolyphosphatase [Liquorilactobacillus capillatus DSM 19910]
MENFVVIDLGSNSLRMTISEIDDNNDVSVTHQLKEMVRLSENMGPEKILQKEPIERTLKALAIFKETYTKLKNVHITALATAAVRQAANQTAFLKLVKKQIGIDFNVISGKREAYLDFLAVTRTLPIKDKCIIMDTGGASTELVLVEKNKISDLISLPFGSVTLSQEFALDDDITASKLFKAMTFVEKKITDINWLFNAHKAQLVVLGGSNRTLAKIARREQHQNKLTSIHGYKLTSDAAFDIFANLVDLNQAKREKIPGLAKARADVIVGGLIPISLILRTLHITDILFSNNGLREGALLDYLDSKC